MIDDNDPRSTYAFARRMAATTPPRRPPPEIPPPRPTRSSSPWVNTVRRLGAEGAPCETRLDLYESQDALRTIARRGDTDQLVDVFVRAGHLDSPAMTALIRTEVRALLAWTPMTAARWLQTHR